MTSDPAKTPLRMTAQEFVTCIAVMAAQGKANRAQKKSPPKLVALEEQPLKSS